MKRIKAFNNFESAQSVGIIFSAAHQESYATAKTFIASLKEKGIDAQGLGYVTEDKALGYFSYHQGIDFIAIDDNNWYFKPKSQITRTFSEQQFDIRQTQQI